MKKTDKAGTLWAIIEGLLFFLIIAFGGIYVFKGDSPMDIFEKLLQWLNVPEDGVVAWVLMAAAIVGVIVAIGKLRSGNKEIKKIDTTVQKTEKLLGATEEKTVHDMIDASTEKVTGAINSSHKELTGAINSSQKELTGAIGGISEKLAFLQGVQSNQKEPLQQMQGAIESFAKTLAENSALHKEVEQLQQALTEREQEILSKDIQIESLTADVIDLEEKLNAALQPPQTQNMDFTP